MRQSSNHDKILIEKKIKILKKETLKVALFRSWPQEASREIEK